MADEEIFEPRLGRIRAPAAKLPTSFRSRVLKATQRSGGFAPAGGGASKRLSPRGRGGGAARVISARGRRGANGRRVMVKARYIKLAGKGLKAAAAHLSYIRRDGVTREGAPGQMYGAETDGADARAFMDRSAADKVQFRFIVSPEDADQYPDLKPFIRRLMSQMEQDLGTRLDWVAVDHFNTGHPHTHIVIRGADENGRDLIISREYISHGLRDRAEALVDLDLGPVSEQELATRNHREISQARLTSIDLRLIRDADELGQVSVHSGIQEHHALRAGRLTKLREFGLAEEIAPGRWQLNPDIEPTLRRMGERGDIIKTLHYELQQRGMSHAIADSRIYAIDPGARSQARTIIGQVLKRGVIDGTTDRHYLLVDGTDGRVHFVDIGFGDRTEPLPERAVVRLDLKVPDVRPTDRTIAEVAKVNGGHYDIDAHLAYDPTATQPFAETHVRRLEAIRKLTAGVEREPDGRFKIGADYLDKALIYEQRQASRAPASIEQLSAMSLKDQTRWRGLTWLDQELSADSGAMADAGFGAEVKAALRARQQWLVEQGLAELDGSGQFKPDPALRDVLRRQELRAAGDKISRASGLVYRETRPGDQIDGTLRQSVTLGAGRFAVVERARDFTLVPWRPTLEGHIGKAISGLMREQGVNWSIGRKRGPTIE